MKPSPYRVASLARAAGSCKSYFSWAWISPQGQLIEMDNHGRFALQHYGVSLVADMYPWLSTEHQALLYDWFLDGKEGTLPGGSYAVVSALADGGLRRPPANGEGQEAAQQRIMDEGWLKASNYASISGTAQALKNTRAVDAFFEGVMKCIGKGAKAPDRRFEVIEINTRSGRGEIQRMGYFDALERYASPKLVDRFVDWFN